MFFQLSTAVLALSAIVGVQASAITPSPVSKAQDIAPKAAPVVTRATTNAERLARGLKLNPPTRRTGAPSSKPSAGFHLQVRTGHLEVVSVETGVFIGYVNKAWNAGGKFGLTADVNERLSVNLDVSISTGISVNLAINNGLDASLSLFGGVVAADLNLSLGSANFAYLGGAEASPAGSPACEGKNSVADAKFVQTSIFDYNPTSSLLSVRWVNTDGTTPATTLAYNKEEDALVIVGDKDTFLASSPASQVVVLRLVLL